MAFHLKSRIWQTGNLEWWGIIGDEEMYLGTREFPLPPEEGDEWTVRKTGDIFRIVAGEVRHIGNAPVKEEEWW